MSNPRLLQLWGCNLVSIDEFKKKLENLYEGQKPETNTGKFETTHPREKIYIRTSNVYLSHLTNGMRQIGVKIEQPRFVPGKLLYPLDRLPSKLRDRWLYAYLALRSMTFDRYDRIPKQIIKTILGHILDGELTCFEKAELITNNPTKKIFMHFCEWLEKNGSRSKLTSNSKMLFKFNVRAIRSPGLDANAFGECECILSIGNSWSNLKDAYGTNIYIEQGRFTGKVLTRKLIKYEDIYEDN